MRGALLLISLLSLVAARACFASPLVWPLVTYLDDKYNYPAVNLSTVSISADSYRAFIAQLREILQNPEEDRFSIPVLRNRTNLDKSERFVLVNLSNWAGISVTLALDVGNAFVVGYRAGDYSVFFRTDTGDLADAITGLFTETTRYTLPFTGSYLDLPADRLNVELGAGALEEAVSVMHLYATSEDRSSSRQASIARALLVTIQMVSEAARFYYIENEVSRRIQTNVNTCPDISVLEVENSWDRISTAVQLESDHRGIITNPVQLQRRGGQYFSVDNVRWLTRVVALMLLVNVKCNDRQSSQWPLHPSPLIRLTLSKSDDPDTCHEDLEPTVQIAGPDGLCVDVKDGRYADGNPIQLYPCKFSSDKVNQLWTFKSDGTLRSNGKCLGTYGYKPGSYIMIYDCELAEPDAFKWQVWENGTIRLSSGYGLVLAARSLESGTTLRVQEDTYTIGQSWLPSNNTEPVVAPIVGLSSGLCLEAEGADLLLGMCLSRKPSQAWALYPDGSIRPNETRLDSCLTVPTKGPTSTVKISLCEANSSLQRWVLTKDGTIMNLETQLVMDVTPGSIPSLGEIIMSAFTGNPSQKWEPLMLL